MGSEANITMRVNAADLYLRLISLEVLPKNSATSSSFPHKTQQNVDIYRINVPEGPFCVLGKAHFL